MDIKRKKRFKINTYKMLVVFLLLLFFSTFAQEGKDNDSTIIELAYDDGNPNLKLTFLDRAGWFFITRFTPPSTPVQILTAKYFIADTSNGASFELSVWEELVDEPMEVLFEPTLITVKKTGWNEYDLTDQQIMVDRDFFLQLAYDGKSRISIGAENRDPLSLRTYNTDC